MAAALIAYGSNLGDSVAILQMAFERLSEIPGLSIVRQSRPLVTRPVGGPAGQPPFVNGAWRLETSLSPQQLHACLCRVETELGRQRRERWAARLIDLDLLLYDDFVLRSSALTIPHPRMAFRRFVLEPAAEVGGDWLHPVIGWTVQKLLDHLDQATDYLALTGVSGCGKTELATRTAQAVGAMLMVDPASPHTDPRWPQADDDESAILSRRAECLQAVPWDGGSWVVSDFWMGQSFAYARGEEAAERLAPLWERLVAQVVPPKLLVWIDKASSDPATRTGWQTTLDRYHQGPRLELSADQPDWALHELTAAIQAMK